MLPGGPDRGTAVVSELASLQYQNETHHLDELLMRSNNGER